METLGKFVAAVVGIILFFFFAILIGPLFGGLAGWVVGFFWTAPILDFLARFGVRVDGLTVWQIGVALGFLGGFFKATQTNTNKS